MAFCHLFPIFFNKIREVLIAVRIVYGEIAAAPLRLLVVGRWHGFLFLGGVELVGGFVNFIGFAVFLRLE